MSRVKLLLDVVSDLQALADSLQAVAEAIGSNQHNEIEEPEQQSLVNSLKKNWSL